MYWTISIGTYSTVFGYSQNRVLDELYTTCLHDFSVSECTLVTESLAASVEEFKKVGMRFFL